MSATKTRVALVGTGKWWGWHHARVLSEHPQVDFCGIVGRHPARTVARAAEFNVPHYFSIGEMITKAKPDLVSLCLDNKGHFEPTLEVIKAGIPLFVEKPFVFHLSEADQLLAAAATRKLFFAINFNHRWATPVQKAFHAIREGKLGDLVFVSWRFGGEGPACPEWENLIETQCHGFDMLEHLCGPITAISMMASDASKKSYSSYAINLQFANKAVGSMIGSYDSSYAYPGTQFIELNGTRARICIEDTVRKYRFQEAGNETAEVWQAGYFNDQDRMFHYTFDKHFHDMLQAFRSGVEPPVHARAGKRALQLATAAIASFEEGRTVSVPVAEQLAELTSPSDHPVFQSSFIQLV